jgi:phage terminase large subunit-like protein
MCVLETHSKFEPLSSEEHTLDGLRVHGALIDELHSHKTRNVYDVLETATSSRRQPLVVCITTSGFPFPDSICLELLGYGEKVVKGIIQDDTFFSLSFSLDEGDNWEDEKNWKKANPNLEISVKLEDLRAKATKARETPSAQNNFKTKHLNIWCNSRSRWVPIERWDACKEDFDIRELLGKECYAGLDLSTTTDISALVLVFPWENGTHRVLPFFWVPEENAELRARRDRVPYPLWISQGLITATPGNVIDYSFLRKKINDLADVYKIKEIAADPWNATQTIQQLREEDGLNVIEMRQGFASMSSPMKSLEAEVMACKIRHDGNAVLRWMFDNVSVKMDPAGNIKADKEKSAERIDGVVALIMGLSRAVLRIEKVSPYESRGLLVL